MAEKTLFEFRHIALLSEPDIKKIVDAVSETELIPALKEKTPHLLFRCLNTMEYDYPRRFLVSFLAWGKVPLEESRYYQRRILQTVLHLVQNGEITLPKDFYVQEAGEQESFVAEFEVYDHYEWPRTFEDVYDMDYRDFRIVKAHIDEKDFALCQNSYTAESKEEIKAVQLAQYRIMKTIRSLKASGKIRGMWSYQGYPRKRMHD